MGRIIGHPKFAPERCLIALLHAYLKELAEEEGSSQLILGCLGMNRADPGSFTEKIAGKVVKKAGAQFVLIGSFESRMVFKETNVAINCKIHQAFLGGVVPALCIGESLEERLLKKTSSVLSKQVNEGLKNLSSEQLEAMLIVCEAPWLSRTPKKKSVQIFS